MAIEFVPAQAMAAPAPGFLAPAPTRAAGRPAGAGGACVVLVGLLLLAVLGSIAAPYPDQGEGISDVPSRMLPPSGQHLFGTDQLGRDVLSRIIVGARSAVAVSLLVVGLAAAIGMPLGAIAGYRRGRIDGIIMRLTDLFLAFPPLLLAMAIVAALGPGLDHVALALAISWWPWYARLARGTAVSLRELPYHRGGPLGRPAGPDDPRPPHPAQLGWRRSWSRPRSTSGPSSSPPARSPSSGSARRHRRPTGA